MAVGRSAEPTHNLKFTVKYSINKILLILTAVLLSVPLTYTAAQTEPEIDALQEKLRARYFTPVNPTFVNQARVRLTANGTFSDINYSNNRLEAFQTHLDRVEILIRGYTAGTLAGNSGLLDDIVSSLGYWLDEDYRDPNWWWTYIGFPGRLIPVAVLIAEEMRDTDTEVYDALIAYFTRVYNYSQSNPHGGGANMTDMGYRALVGAIMDRDIDQINLVIEQTFDRALLFMGRNNNWDGWRVDGSFYGHGAQLHNATYGREMALSTTRAATLLKDSPWEFDREVVDLLELGILEGVLPMSWGGWFDYNAAGRGVSRPASQSFANGYIIIIEALLELEPSNPEALELLLDRIRLGPTPEQNFRGTRSYIYTDFMTHIRPDYYTSVRMVSNRTKRNEGALNGEGMKHRYFGDGIQFTVVHGDEYSTIPPIWNYARLPGLTARQESNLTPPAVLGERGSATFANSLTDGRTGLAAMRLQHRDTRGWKTWFVMEEGVLALGSGIQVTSGTANERVLTTLNQTRHGGDVVLGGDSEQILDLPFEHTTDSASYVWHRDVGYLIMGDNDFLTISAENVSGNWSDVGASTGAVSGDVFTLYLDHGVQPQSAAYSYMVLPNASSARTRALAQNPPVEILRQDGGVHAVRHRTTGVVYIVFLQADEVSIGEGVSVAASNPVLVQMVPDMGEWKVLVADPHFNLNAATLTISVDGAVADTLQVSFPSGDWVGAPAEAHAAVPAPKRSLEGESRSRGIWRSLGFGQYVPVNSDWIYHATAGWAYTVTDADQNLFLKPVESNSWIWTRSDLAGWGYDFASEEWLRLD